jgi:hypothetical protein
MIALLFALATSPQVNVKPLLFDCIVSNQSGSQSSLAILARGRKSDDEVFYDPSSFLDTTAMGVRTTADYWPSYWQYEVGLHFVFGPHGERLGTSGGWTIRVEPAKGADLNAAITISDFGTEYTSNNKSPGFVLKGNCTWIEGRRARVTYGRLTK